MPTQAQRKAGGRTEYRWRIHATDGTVTTEWAPDEESAWRLATILGVDVESVTPSDCRGRHPSADPMGRAKGFRLRASEEAAFQKQLKRDGVSVQRFTRAAVLQFCRLAARARKSIYGEVE